VGLDNQGLSAAGQSVPLPNPLGDVLASQGITLRYLAAATDADGRGVTAPGLLISVTAPLNTLPAEPLGTGPSTVTYTFGRSTARATGGLIVAAPGTTTRTTTRAGTSPTTPTGPPGTAPGPADTNGQAAAPTGSGTVTGDLSGGLTAPPATGGESPAVAPVQAADGSASTVTPAADALRQPADVDWELIYLAVAVGAGAVIGGNLLLRYLGERLGWT
jgi:hypothetical protein